MGRLEPGMKSKVSSTSLTTTCVAGVNNRRWNDESRTADPNGRATVKPGLLYRPAGRGRPGRVNNLLHLYDGPAAGNKQTDYDMRGSSHTFEMERVCDSRKPLRTFAAPRTGCLACAAGSGGETSLDNKGRPAAYSASGASLRLGREDDIWILALVVVLQFEKEDRRR
ncbi:hypothetical protein B0T13DRAFT_445001 [Neurospora crassa]|nr:hypothetical protein B0T13DRAFT_445001 [Neurospora crassa]